MERSLNNSTWTTLAAANSGITYNNTGLTAGTTYYYRVSGNNAGGSSLPLTAVSAAAPGVAHADRHFISPTEIDFSWPASNGATGYTLEISTDSGTTFTSLATPTTNS